METDARELDFSGDFQPNVKAIPTGIKWITAARTLRWFGWGFAETLLPVFILTFAHSLTEAGLINSVYDLFFLISLPIVGFLADKISSRALLVTGLLMYPFIGLSYYLAGAMGLVFFVILARCINGVSYCLDTVGTDTYIRRLAPQKIIASAFGYIASWANLGWLIAALIGVFLVKFLPISVLLSFVIPFSILAMIPLLLAKKDAPEDRAPISSSTLLRPIALFLKEIVAMRKGLRGVVFLMFAFDFAIVASTFFIPIAAYRSGATLSAVAFLCVLSAVPTLFEFWLAEFIDGSRAKRKIALFASLLVLPVLFLCASLFDAFSARVAIAFGIELAAILGSLALQSYATALSRRERFGEISSVLEGASTLGDLAAPVLIGILADAMGFMWMFSLVAIAFLLIAGYFVWLPIEKAPDIVI